MKNAYILFVLICLGLAACSFVPSREQVAKADFGSKPDQSVAIATIRNYLERVLIDPDSMKLACSEARKGWADDNFGWVIYCEVNAKNRLGGYTGAQPHVYLFNGNRLSFSRTDSVKRGMNYDYVN